MFNFLKDLMKQRDQEVTLLMFKGDPSGTSSSYRFTPQTLWVLLGGIAGGVVILTLLLLMFTPLSGFLYTHTDAAIREQVIEVSQKVRALQDSLRVRDVQLVQMQQIITRGDTTFPVPEDAGQPTARNRPRGELNPFTEVEGIPEVSQHEIIFSETFDNIPAFPADYPVDGTLTRGFNVEKGHYGIDIATSQGQPFKAIADGVVINQEWTVNFGYVIHVQHNNGYISIFKHAASLSKSIGDIVRRGDILGTTGNSGVLSSGVHLHLELWKNGVPQKPTTYLIKT